MSTIIDHCAMSYPYWPDGTRIVLTVLVQRIEGTKKAYAAIVPDVSRTDPYYATVRQWVKSNGTPLRYREANAIWPMPEKDYAR